jgi:tRNA threonylcarbamoyladenosine biosynthesis protein TsaB
VIGDSIPIIVNSSPTNYESPFKNHRTLKLLAIDTSTDACSAALSLDGAMSSRYTLAPRRHAELILSMVDELLREADTALTRLDALAFGRGPGAFTGVRIAAGVIQGLALAAELPVVPVSSLAALAQGAITKSDCLISAIDARMGEVYWGLFQVRDRLALPVQDEAVTRPERMSVPADRQWFGVGNAWQAYARELSAAVNQRLIGRDESAYPHARDMIPLAAQAYAAGGAVPAELALPVYLRNPVAG